MNPRHLLVLKPSSLGDVVHTLPAVSCLRTKFPDARITWMISDEWAPLLEGNPDINDLLVFPRREFRGLMGPARFLRWRSTLRDKLSPDLILDFQGLLRTGLIAAAFRGAPVYGLSDAREGARFFQRQTVSISPGMHAVERYLALAAATGASTHTAPEFRLPAGRAPRTTLPAAPWILLHPFSRGSGKSLTSEAVFAFCREIGMPVILAGRSGETLPPLPDNTVNLLNKTSLHELIWLLRNAACVVSVDSGPMHLAAGVNDKLIGIHTWTDPCKVGPYCTGATVWKGREFFPALDPASSRSGADMPDTRDATTIARHVEALVSDR